eukprot:2679359-Prymnesium_polylepis.1
MRTSEAAKDLPLDIDDEFAADFTTLHEMLDQLRAQGLKDGKGKKHDKGRSRSKKADRGAAYGAHVRESRGDSHGEGGAHPSNGTEPLALRDALRDDPVEGMGEVAKRFCDILPIFNPEVRRSAPFTARSPSSR